MLNNRKKAFTLVEVLIVLVTLSILMVVLVSAVNTPVHESNRAQAEADINSLAFAVNSVGLKNQTFDIDQDLLAAHINAELSIDMRLQSAGDHIASTSLDPWGSAYHISTAFPENTNGIVTIRSIGPDRQLGTSDDVMATVTYDTTNNLNRLIV